MFKYFFTFLILIHGIIHIIGFVKPFDYGNMGNYLKNIPKLIGLLWLLSALLFIIATILFFLNNNTWAIIAITAVIISQVLIAITWNEGKFGTIANAIIIFVAISSWSIHRFEMQFKNDVEKHLSQSVSTKNDILTEADIISLPIPVQKYLQYTGVLNKPKVKNAKIIFEGQMREKGKDFFNFTSVQYNFFDNPTRLFFMKAKMYGTAVTGYHCYQNATATMQVKLLGMFNVANVKGNEMNKAETVTVFNDMCLMAPATLIDTRIKWTSIDSLTAMATFTNDKNKITATLYFNEIGQLINFISDDRYTVSDMKQYRFSTPVKDYKLINGIKVPMYGETIWHYPDGVFVYGKFNLRSIEYNAEK
jgi:hypothetical protein